MVAKANVESQEFEPVRDCEAVPGASKPVLVETDPVPESLRSTITELFICSRHRIN